VTAHLLGIDGMDRAEIEELLDLTDTFAEIGRRPIARVPALRGRTVATLFFEDSTRTRVSFDTAAKRLSADTLNFAAGSSSLSKGESLRDTVDVIASYGVDALVVRHPMAGTPHRIADWTDASVVNAGDGAHEHPTQALLDTFTMFEKKGDVSGLNVTILGDILYSRVARSNIWALTKLGANVTLCGPPTLVPRIFEKMGCRVTHNVDEALADADIVNLLRIQHERQRLSAFPSIGEYRSLFGLTNERFARLKPDAIVMHPGPINRGVEIDSEIADHPRSTILDQVINGLAVRMAVMFLVSGGKTLPEPGE